MQSLDNSADAVREIEHCWIPLVDGTRLAARLWLPAATALAPAPAIFEYIPYRKSDISRLRDEGNLGYFAGKGYATLRVDMRGSGDSEGVMPDMYAPAELDDALQVIDWIARQPWCNGSVGMMGTSWGGTSSLQVAARQPAALKAIIAVCATNDRYNDDIHHMGGCVLTDSVEWGATLPAILAAPPDPELVGPGWRKQWMARLEAMTFPLENWIKHETRSDYWRWGSVAEARGGIACPVLAVGGWVDRYSNTVMNLLAQNPERCWGIVGPWGHHYPDKGCPGPAIGFQQEALRWWDRWLRGQDNGVEHEPRLRVWMQDYAEPQDKIEVRSGRWVAEARWPMGDQEVVKLHLAPGQLHEESGQANCRLEVPFGLAVGDAAGDSGYFGRSGGLPLDQTADDACSLLFESAPLEEPLEILGAARLSVSFRGQTRAPVLVARLIDVPPEGAPARVVFGVKNMGLDAAQAGPVQLLPDETGEAEVVFPNTAYRFEKGHRIRLALTGSYWPLLWPGVSGDTLELDLRGAALVLPMRDRSAGDGQVAFSTPLKDLKHSLHCLESNPIERWNASDPARAKRRSGWTLPVNRIYFRNRDWGFGYETRAQYSVTLNEPASARTEFEHRLHFERGDWKVEVIGRAALSADQSAYYPVGSLEVRENGEVIFQRAWSPAVARRFA